MQQAQFQAKILGTGRYLPQKILSNADLEKMVDTTDDWIVSRTGMKERRIAAPQEFTSDMGVRAAEEALRASGVAASDVDCILFATLTPDYVFPSTACLVQQRLGAHRAAALDIQAACTGYLYGLSIAKAFVESGTYRHVLVIAAEKLSSIVNYQDRNTCILFGDGAAAALVSSQQGPGCVVRDVTLGADGEQSQLLILPAGGSRRPASQETIDQNLHYLQMEGKEVFKHAVRRMEAACLASLNNVQIQQTDIRWFIAHQANIRIIEALAERLGVPLEQVFVTIQKYGNTSASSLGIALDELMRDVGVQAGDHILLTAFGAGLTWGAAVITYE